MDTPQRLPQTFEDVAVTLAEMCIPLASLDRLYLLTQAQARHNAYRDAAAFRRNDYFPEFCELVTRVISLFDMPVIQDFETACMYRMSGCSDWIAAARVWCMNHQQDALMERFEDDPENFTAWLVAQEPVAMYSTRH